jgi:flagellar protein FlaJ
VPFLLFIISIFAFYLYPSSEKGTANSRIAQEMPFATIYMTAIAGSNVEPSKIFKILSLSKEYPYISQELKKVISQVEIYGYDLVSSLKNAAKRTASESFSELLGGIATNISSGGSLKDYLEKKTENFLADYKLERQKYNSLAELFMDIYISVLITGPLILMVLFMVMNLGKFQIGGLSMNTLLILTVGLVVFANIVFIIILDIKQPKN